MGILKKNFTMINKEQIALRKKKLYDQNFEAINELRNMIDVVREIIGKDPLYQSIRSVGINHVQKTSI